VDKKPLIVVSILAVVLLVLGSLSHVVGYQTVQSIKSETLSSETNNNINDELWEKTIYRLCHLQSGDIRHKNFDGWFIGYPSNHYEFSHFGVGSFTLVLQRDYFTEFGVGSIFNSQYFAFGMDQTVRVTEYTSDHMSVKWINMENLGKFTMPQLIIKNLQSTNESEMTIYPPPYYIWKNATSIISITDNSVTVETTPTKTTHLSDTIMDVRDGEKQMLILPSVTTASWDDDTITIISEPIVGQNYTFQTPGYQQTVTITVHINKIVGDKVNATITNDQSPDPSYLDFYKELTFNRIYALPRYYNDIPTSYITYFYGEDIERTGYSLEPVGPITYEVTVEKIYKTSLS